MDDHGTQWRLLSTRAENRSYHRIQDINSNEEKKDKMETYHRVCQEIESNINGAARTSG